MSKTSPVEAIIRPIVEGKIRSFLKEHASILDCVVWFKPREDRATTFVNSLAKRIVRDLTSDVTIGRLRTALLDGLPRSGQEEKDSAHHSDPSASPLASLTGGDAPSSPGWYYGNSLRLASVLDEAQILKVIKDRSGALMVQQGQLYPLDQFVWYGPVPRKALK